MFSVDKLKTQIRTQQGANFKSWTPPPFYGPLTIPDLYAFHAENSPEHPVIVYDNEDGSVQTLRYKDVFPAMRRAAQLVSSCVLPPANADDGYPNRVVGILAVADFLADFSLILGTMYAGHTPFPIAPTHTAPAVAQLLRKTSASVLFVSQDSAMQRLAREVQDLLALDEYAIHLLPCPTFPEMFKGDVVEDVKRVPVTGDIPAIILHSSGSTAHPKPVTYLHRDFSRWAFMPYFGVTDFCGRHVSMHSRPLYHASGMVSITRPVGTGAVIGGFRPSSPPIVATPENVLNALVATQCVSVICMPAFLEAWARDPKCVELLRNRSIVYTGAPLNKDVGDMLSEKDVHIFAVFGSTECVMPMSYTPATRMPGNWEYFTFPAIVEFVRRYHDGIPGVFEPIILDSPTWSPNVFNCEVDGRRAYAMGDWLIEHPDDPDLWKVNGRIDDQIALASGLKTNPMPMESIMTRDPHIHAALMFGHGRPQTGVIIQPTEPFDPLDESKLAAFRNLVWPTVERANSVAQSYSHIAKEMITVTSSSKPLLFTAKGTVFKPVSLAEYKDEIDELYRKVEGSC